MYSRIDRLRKLLEQQGLPALLVTKRENCLYLSGFSGSAGELIITGDRQIIISDFRYKLQIAKEAPDWELILAEQSLDQTIGQVLKDLGVDEVGIEANDLSINRHRLLVGEGVPYSLRITTDFVEELRISKDPEELSCMREAVRITDAAYEHLTTLVRPGITELELALEAEWFMRRNGAEAAAFPMIVATGDHSALCHAQPGNRALKAGDMVVVDMGARFKHYCADMTRTFAVAKATPIAQEIYSLCARAQAYGLTKISAGISGAEADQLVRDIIVEGGYGEYFGHGTGHGVGLEVHEAPRLSRSSAALLPVNAAVTVEPGIYLPGVGGVRIEDLVIIGESWVEVLTAAPKPLTIPLFDN